jgi:D-arginine dehydrogenase
MRECDYLIVGAGIAGASLAYQLAGKGRSIVLLEREDQPGYHSTGRSAAVYTENYGPRIMRVMSKLSGDHLRHPPSGYAEVPLMHPRGAMFIAREDQVATIEAVVAELSTLSQSLHWIDLAEAYRRAPCLRPGYVAKAALDLDTMDMDVNAIYQGYLRSARRRGAEVVTRAEVTRLERVGGKWHAHTPAGEFAAPVAVNAAGAWADELAARAGIRTVGLQPKRRTVIVFDPPHGVDPSSWVIVADCEEQFYFKPETGRILASPADETPVPPQDVQPEEEDKALIAHRVEQASTLEVKRIVRAWAGLRSFVADKNPVVGFAPDAEGFFWLAGQGGYGIQTSYAMGLSAASLLRGEALPEAVTAYGVTESDLGPSRLWA